MKGCVALTDSIESVDTNPPPLLRRWHLPVGDGHQMQVQEFGPADGRPVLVLHGGPGSGCGPLIAQPFAGGPWRAICPDQRGSGGSTPAGSVDHNTTAHLLADLRALRRALGIDRWAVVGGSWGATLAVAYAADEPQAVSALLLRSSFLARPEDVHWFFEGAAAVKPDDWRLLRRAVPDGAPLLPTLHAWLTGEDAVMQAHAARTWRRWELALAGQPPLAELAGDALAAQVQRLRIQAHYLLHGCWMEPPLLQRCERLPPVPTLLLHAKDDWVCRYEGALRLRAALPHAAWTDSDSGGHDPSHPALRDAMAAALQHLARHGHFAA